MPDRDGVLAGRLGAGALSIALIAAVLSLGVASAEAKTTGAPVQVTPPALSGAAVEGGKLKAAAGTWSGRKPIHYAYAWSRCDASGQECSPLAGPAKAAYKPTLADVGHTLLVRVTATNEEGSASASAPASAPVAPAAPRRRKPGVIAGAAQDGQVLSAGSGTWKGTPPFTFSYQWESCVRRSCEPIAGATDGTYRATTADLGRQLRALVTATNGVGSAQSLSKASERVLPGPPVNLSAPTVSGTPLIGQQLSASPGTWAGTGPIEYAYQWRSCNLLGGCSDVAGATQPTYTVGPLDVANSLEVVVTASNAQGAAGATSTQTGLIKTLPPANLGLPSIAGLLEDGGLLSALTGEWSSEEPLSFAYQWQLCDAAGQACSDVSEALASTLKLLPGFVGSTLRVIVTATNSAGSVSAASEPTSIVKALLPSNTSLPSIAGLLQDGGLLSAVTGSWSGTGPLSYGYQWKLCNAAGEACSSISEALASTLQLTGGLVGDTLRVVVTATNAAGSTSATSEPTGLVKALLPSNTSLPGITGLLQDGGLLSAVTGSWTGTGPLGYSYQWQQCDAKGEACKGLSGATGATLGLVSSLVGSTVRVVVTATNAAGSTSATSEPTSLVKALLPGNTSPPSVIGSLIDGQTLSAATGSWSGTGPLGYSYQWQQCDAKGEACKGLSGATGATLGLVSSLVGSTVRVVVTATNAAGSTSATSEPTSLVKALLPSNSALPSIGGVLEDGKTLTGASGSWSGTAPIAYAYQWQQCNAKGEECKAIASEGGKETLGLVSSLVKSTVRLVVTATNSGGSTQAVSAPTSPVLAALPIDAVAPTISGILKLGERLLAHHETWTGTAPIAYTYQWQLCGLLGLVGECKNIAGATGENLLLELLDVGLTLRVGVTAHNERGSSETAYSKVTGLVAGL